MFRMIALIPRIAYRIRGALLRYLIILAGGRCGPGLRVEQGLRIRQGLHKGWQLGTDVYVGRNTTIDCLPHAVLTIGDNVTLTEGTFISVGAKVEIGSQSLIGEYSSLRDANHGIILIDVPITGQPMLAEPIRIAENVWIGRGCAILSGVSIGHGAVIGANSVVTRDLCANGIHAGAPAKLIRMRTDA